MPVLADTQGFSIGVEEKDNALSTFKQEIFSVFYFFF